MSAEGEGENLGDTRRTGAPGVALGHDTALTPDAVAPGQQRQAQHGVAQLEDDAQRSEDVHQLRGRGIDPHGAGQKPEEGKDLPGRGVSRCVPQDPAHLRPAVSLLGTLVTGKEVLAPALHPGLSAQSRVGCAGHGWAFGAGGHLTQWYLGGSSLLVVMKVMTARTEPTSVTSPQTGKMPWIWYSPSAHGREREHQSGPATHHVGWGRIRPGLSPTATSTLSPHGAAPLCASVSPNR